MKVNFMKFKDVLNLVLCEERDIGSFETTDGIWENLNGYNYTEYSDSAIPEKWYKGIDVDNY